MKLETRITVYKKKDSLGVFSRLIAGSPDYHIDSIEVIISDAFRIFVHPQKPTDFRKFKRTPERIIHEINKNLKNIQLFSSSGGYYYAAWAPYEYEATGYVVYLGESDLEKIKLKKEEKNKIRNALNAIPKKGYVYNPSKDKSEMEYRKRAYYGKCKKR